MDTIVALPLEQIDALAAEFDLPLGVSFAAESEFDPVFRRISDHSFRTRTENPGGPVNNTLHALGTLAGSYPRTLDLMWLGPYAPSFNYIDADPLAALRQVGVRIICTPTSLAGPARTICMVEAHKGETRSVLVGPRGNVGSLDLEFGPEDLVITCLADLPDLDWIYNRVQIPKFVLLTGDQHSLDKPIEKALRRLLSRDSVRFLFGQYSEFRRLGFVDNTGALDASLREVEAIATEGSGPVRLFLSEEFAARPAAVSSSSFDMVNFLGAGDAYAAGYLFSRLQGEGWREAHQAGVDCARLVSYSSSARREYTANLSQLFGSYIERASAEEDWWLANRVRQTCGLTIVTCGQTGVDSRALSIARSYGLASIALMPEGRRHEGHDGVKVASPQLDGSLVIELGSPSYRYCTWANVYAGDGTWLLDYAMSEGSAETRRAGATLGRPVLELARIARSELASTVANWVQRYGVRVLHIAGNRDSLLSDKEREDAGWRIDVALRVAAGLLSHSVHKAFSQPESVTGIRNRSSNQQEVGWRLGIPKLEEVSRSFRRYLDERDVFYEPHGELAYHVGEGAVYLGRSLDLVRMLRLEVLDAALVGTDMLAELGGPDLEVLVKSGFFNCVLGVVGDAIKTAGVATVLSQYPRVSERIYGDAGVAVTPIVGSAETWIGAGAFDAAVDTWRTGRTAEHYGLRLLSVIESTSLALVARKGYVCSPASDLGLDYVEWLRFAREY